jgi:hypothetical protein
MPYGPPPADRQGQPYPGDKPSDWIFSPTRYLASTVIDRQVLNESGDYIGRVTDLLIDIPSGKVKKIIIEVDDVRADDSQVAVPYEPPGFTGYGIVYDISRQEISKLPSYTNE